MTLTTGIASYPIDPSLFKPLYAQVEEDLFDRIRRGEWASGARIPTESQLCTKYGVSRVTVRQALGNLADRGLLVRGRGRGTFVRDARFIAGARGVSSFSTELKELGMAAGSRLLSFDTVKAGQAVAPDLRCEPGEPLHRIRRLRTGDGEPIGVQTSLLIAERFPGLADHLVDNGSLYDVLRQTYGVNPVEAFETFTVGGVPANLATLLGASRGSHAFLVQRITFDNRGAFEHTSSVMRGDRYQLRLSLRNP